MIPDAGFQDNDILCLTFHPDGETMTGTLKGKQADKVATLFEITSGGVGGIWEGMQNVFFDGATEVPAIKQGFIAHMPGMLVSDASGKSAPDGRAKPLSREEEGLVAELVTNSSAKKRGKTWKERSGRKGGNDGYKFGDVSRALLRKVVKTGHKDQPAEERLPSAEHESNQVADDTGALRSNLLQAKASVQALRERCAKLELRAQGFAFARLPLFVLGCALGFLGSMLTGAHSIVSSLLLVCLLIAATVLALDMRSRGFDHNAYLAYQPLSAENLESMTPCFPSERSQHGRR